MGNEWGGVGGRERDVERERERGGKREQTQIRIKTLKRKKAVVGEVDPKT